MIFDLSEETYEPYNKPQNIPQYVNKLSNPPPAVIRNIPASVNKRLSSISSSEAMFKKAAPLYQEALEKSGYSCTLKYEPQANNPKQKKRGRKRHILWFNPPYNHTVRTNVAREFLSLIDKCFPPGHPLRKIFNRNTVKVAYSTTPNMSQIIAGKNAKILNHSGNQKRTCSCPSTKICPLDRKCLTDNLVYQATVTHPDKVILLMLFNYLII